MREGVTSRPPCTAHPLSLHLIPVSSSLHPAPAPVAAGMPPAGPAQASQCLPAAEHPTSCPQPPHRLLLQVPVGRPSGKRMALSPRPHCSSWRPTGGQGGWQQGGVGLG
eukprot:1155117-Pelagomonas_calceolata.AAC.4